MYYNQRLVKAQNLRIVRRTTQRLSNAPSRLLRLIRRTRVTNFKRGSKPIKKYGVILNIPGANYIFDSKRGFFNKLFWFVIVMCSVITCSYQVYDRIQLFLSNPIATRITITRNDSVKIPSVTICRPLNSRIATYPRLQQKLKGGYDCHNHPFTFLPELNISTIWDLMNTDKLITGHFASASKENTGDTNVKLYKTRTLTTFGNCVTYSIKQPVSFKAGYTFEIYFASNKLSNPCNASSIANYFFHDDDVDMTYVDVDDFIKMQPHSKAEYALTAKQFLLINRTDAPCDSVAAVSQCKKKCFEDIFTSHIQCRLPITQTDDIPLCTLRNTTHEVYERVYDLTYGFPYTEKCSCPSICEEIIYQYNKKYTAYMYNGRVKLNYYYESNVITIVEEYYSYLLVPFLCEVGGNLGLYLGLCIPAIIELLQSVVVYIYNKIINLT